VEADRQGRKPEGAEAIEAIGHGLMNGDELSDEMATRLRAL
jgi:hypothetical protein